MINSELKELLSQINDDPLLIGDMLGYDKLLPIHRQWIIDCWTQNNYVLQAHRNSYKTTAVLVVGAIWYLLLNPDTSILIVRKDFESATAILSEITKHYRTNEALINLYLNAYGKEPIERLRQDSLLLSTKEKVDARSSIEVVSIGGTITGKHYDKVFTDDIVTIRDRTSKAERETTKLFVNELFNIPVPGGTITHTGTPWHPEDAFSILPKADRYPIGHPDLVIPEFTPEFVGQLKKAMTSSLWAANYELVHIADEGRIFSNPNYADWPKQLITRVNAYCDPAYKGDNCTALAMIAETIEKKYYVRGWVWRKDIADLYQTIVDLLKLWKCGTMWVESNADKGYSARDFMRLWPATVEINESTNKHIKIIANLKPAWDKLLFATDCQSEFVNQILDYQEGQEPDDACFVAGTKVATITGNKNIEDIKVGDKLITPFGIKEVLYAGSIGEKKIIKRIGLCGTYNHKIFNKVLDEFTSLDTMTSLISCDILTLGGLVKWGVAKEFFLMENGIVDLKRENIISLKAYQINSEKILRNFIGQFMSFIQGKKYAKDIMSIIKILIVIITSMIIWNCWKLGNIYQFTVKRILKILNIEKERESKCAKFKNLLKRGIGVQRGTNGTNNTLNPLYLKHGNIGKKEIAFNAERNTLQKLKIENFVLTNVDEGIERDLDLKLKKNVLAVGKNLKLWAEQKKESSVLENVKANKIIEKERVYNLTVSGGVYYANNILVSNCDALAALVRGMRINQNNGLFDLLGGQAYA